MTLDRLEKIRKLLRSDIDERAEGLPKEMLEQAYEIIRVIHKHDEMAEAQRVREEQGLPEAWTAVGCAWLPTGGTTGRVRRKQVKVGDIVKVYGLGKRTGPEHAAYGGRGTSAGWKITGIAQRGDETNVVVRKNGVERTVRLDRII